ncbi:MAG: alpha/beta fold hydrolase [Limnochordales bacterium]
MTGVAAVPKFRVGDIHLYYELHGTGPPLLLLAGLGMPATIWYHQVPAFAARHQVILVDNRGAGRSDHPLGDYTVAQMALDTARLLAGLGVEISAAGVAERYAARDRGGCLDGWLVHTDDSATVPGVQVRSVPLLMSDVAATAEMAKAAFDLAEQAG